MTKETEANVDLDTISDLRDLTPPSLFKELIELYLADSRRRLDDIKNAFQKSDFAALSSAAHGLKGSSLSIGVSSVAELSAKIERAAQTGTQHDLTTLVESVEQRFLGIIGVLEDLIIEN